MKVEQLHLTTEEAVTVFQALVLAEECLREGLRQTKITVDYTPVELAELEEKAYRFSDLLEKFRGIR